MKNAKLKVRFFELFSLVVAGMLFGGCSGPNSKIDSRMQAAGSPPAMPPAGKSLVCIHYPFYNGARFFRFGFWDGTTFIGTLGINQSVAYVCEPGQHYFVGRMLNSFSVVEARLLPDQTYDLPVHEYGLTLHFYGLRPIKQPAKEREKVEKWTQRHVWLTRDAATAEYEQQNAESVSRTIERFTSGSEKNNLLHLAPEDHR